MRAPRLLPSCFLFAVYCLGGWLRADVVINEIYFRTPIVPETTNAEYIELRNTGAAAVSLAGWQFAKGVSFTFAAGTSIPAGGYLVVAADLAAFSAQYPGVGNVVGNWSGSLANSGEQIKLVDALGVAQDSVNYFAEGDWAERVSEVTFGGWDWLSLANGYGRSLELRNPALDHHSGQNWAMGLTPGRANFAMSTDIEPIIRDVKHSPASPRSNQAVTVSCNLLDETPAAGLSAVLFWRDASSATPGAFTQTAMTGDGSGNFAATLPAMPNLTVVEFYVRASDGAQTRTWPAATGIGQIANCQYQVTNEVFAATDAYYLLVLTGAENAAYNATAPSDTAGNKIDRQFNTTLVVVNGADTTIRYRSQIRFRGNSSRTYQFKPLRVSLAGDDAWDGVTAFNLNPKASYLQFMGMRLLQASGVRAPDSIPVRPRRNGVESTTSSGSTPDYGRWVREEDINGDFVSAHFPEAKGGGIYKKIRPDRYWRNRGWTVPTDVNGNIDGWLKQNNSAANDWTDLTGFFATAQAVTAPHFPLAVVNDSADSTGGMLLGNGRWDGTAFSAAEMTTLETVADLDQWARWFAAMTILQDFETNISNGQDDDYTFYFAPGAGNQRRAHLVSHDMDTIFGLGDTTQAFNAVGLYDPTDNTFVFRPLLPLLGNNVTAGNAAFRQKYHDALRLLLGTVFDADNTVNPNPPFYQFVDNHLAGWVPVARMTAIKDFVRQRRTYLLGLIGSGAITPAAATSTGTLTSAHGALFISEVLARNVAALQNGAGFPDFIELRNTDAVAVDLAGMSLTDDPLVPAKYVFPAGTTIAAGAHLVVFADADAAAPGLHTGFALDQDGDTVRLLASGGALVDAVTFGPQATDRSIARTGAAQDLWALTVPTPSAVNGAPVALGNVGAVWINEIATNPDTLFTDDFLELYNPGAQPAALGGVAVTDDVINYPAQHVLPALSFMDAAGWLVLRPKGSGASPGNPSELPFKLGATTAWAYLIGANGTAIDTADTFSMPQDFSRGRAPDAGATLAYFGLPANIPTPGAANVAPPAGVLALLNQLRITEIHYTPAPLEFIELRNFGATALDLSGVRFTKGIEYTFAAGTTLAPGGYVVLCADRAAFLTQYGVVSSLASGVLTGTLDNADDTLVLQPPAPWDVNILSFTYSGSWFAETALGNSLVVANAGATPVQNWGRRETWGVSMHNTGSPGFAENFPPVFTKGADQTVREDAGPQTIAGWASGISAGPAGEAAQVVTFLVSTDNPALFSAPPAVFANGALTYQAGTNASGSATVTVRARDDGGGTDTSAAQTFTITVLPVNDVPVITTGPSLSLLENSGPQSLAGWATGIGTGAANESAQTVTIQLTATTSALFSVQPAVSADGTLSFTPAPGMSGSTSVDVTISDDGGIANGGADRAVRNFTITLRPINHAPVFTAGANVVTGIRSAVAQDWATGIAPGTAAESAQLIAFFVTSDHPELFTVAPMISPAGRLTFTAGARAGIATVTVRLKDDGGTSDGGADTSAPVVFTIRLTSAAQFAGVYRGLAGPAPGAAAEFARLGSWQIVATATGTFTARVLLGGNAWTFTGRLTDSGLAVFGRFGFARPLVRTGQSTLTLNFHADFGSATPTLAGQILNGPAPFATLAGERDAYSAARPVPTSVRDAASAGNYTAAFAALPAPNGGLDAGRYPRGDGWAIVVVNAAGVVSVRGQLADGSVITYASALNAANGFPFFLPLYTQRGGIGGEITFNTTAATSLETSGLAWYRPASSGALYPQGWRDGIALGLEGSPRNLVTTPNALPLGSAALTFTDGGLTSAGLAQPVTIAAGNRVTLPAPNPWQIALVMRQTGAWGGSFIHPVTRRKVLFQGVILGDRNLGTGYFSGGAESGRAIFVPAP